MDFAVALDRGTPAVGGILDHRVIRAFTNEPATVLVQVAEQVAPLHATSPCGTTATLDAADNNR